MFPGEGGGLLQVSVHTSLCLCRHPVLQNNLVMHFKVMAHNVYNCLAVSNYFHNSNSATVVDHSLMCRKEAPFTGQQDYP